MRKMNRITNRRIHGKHLTDYIEEEFTWGILWSMRKHIEKLLPIFSILSWWEC
jgi:hypothetical protein